MACNPDPIEGDASNVYEQIYPMQIWEPKQKDTRREYIHFSSLVKGVTSPAKKRIKSEGGFKGNLKRYGMTEEHQYLTGTFSWWSVDVPQEEVEILKNNLPPGAELADMYIPGSRYGTNLFRCDVDKLLSLYQECCDKRAEIKVLGTYKYTREVMHAFVVAPKDNYKFRHHVRVALHHDNFPDLPVMVGNRMQMRPIVQQMYSWNPFSVIKWNDNSRPPKQRMWAHLAFAFYLDPLPDGLMKVPEVCNEDNWETCSLQGIDRRTTLDED